MAGIECSPKIFDFRANGIPTGESVDFFDTLNRTPIKTVGVRFFTGSAKRAFYTYEPLFYRLISVNLPFDT